MQVAKNTYQTIQNKQYAQKATMTLPPNEVRQLFESNNIGKAVRLSRAVQRENRKKGRQHQQQPDSRNTKLDIIMAELVQLRQNQDGI